MSLLNLSPIAEVPNALLEREKVLERLDSVYRVEDAIADGEIDEVLSNGQYNYMRNFGTRLCERVIELCPDQLDEFKSYVELEKSFFRMANAVVREGFVENAENYRGIATLVAPTLHGFVVAVESLFDKVVEEPVEEVWSVMPQERVAHPLEELKWVVPCFNSPHLKEWEGSLTYLTYHYGYRNRQERSVRHRRECLREAIRGMGLIPVIHHLMWLISLKYKSPNEYELVLRYIDDLEWIENNYDFEWR